MSTQTTDLREWRCQNPRCAKNTSTRTAKLFETVGPLPAEALILRITCRRCGVAQVVALSGTFRVPLTRPLLVAVD